VTLAVEHVRKRFGSVIALDDLSFEVAEGEVFGFLGPNGAGKTTTMRIALGVVRADSGRITWRGRSPLEMPRRVWGYLPEERGLYHRMVVLDQLVYFGELYGLTRERATRSARAWLARFQVPELAERRAEELSKGNQQKVQLVAAVLHDPEVMLMDEPFTGLDPVNVSILREAFLDLRRDGKTLVFSTHQMQTVETMCESVAIVDRGRLVVGGRLRDVKRSAGRLAVRIGFEAATDTGWLDAIGGASVIRRGVDEAELALDAGAEPDAILAAALSRGLRIRRFEVVEPSLEQVFLERVGRAPDAPVGGVPTATAAPGDRRSAEAHAAADAHPGAERPTGFIG
jgi:ABC-2 type transport system ATP-binding protein